MALRVAVASGSWSNPAIWNGGVLPTTGDVVASNNFTVTIDQNVNVDSITNAAATVTTAIPTMTSNTTPSGIASASNITSATYDAFKAFDANSGTWWGAGTVGVGNPKWLSYEFPVAKAIDKYYIQGVNNGTEQGPKDWEFQGWNGTSWITLHTVTGNTTTYTSPLIGNSTAYIKYRLYVTLGQNTNLGIINLEMYEYLGTTAAVAGGTFLLGGGINVTCTGGGLIPGAVTLLTWNGGAGTVSNINSTFVRGMTALGRSVVLSGLGTINITSDIVGPVTAGAISTLYIDQNSTVNIVGSLSGGSTSGDTSRVVWVNSVCTLNITGNIIGQTNPEANSLYISASAIVRVTGNVTGNGTSGTNNKAIRITSGGPAAVLEVTGTITSNVAAGAAALESATSSYFKHIGAMIVNGSGPCFINGSTSAINIFSGPFISSTYGFFPYQCVRMHLIPSVTTYLEFRDETTNGALSPGAIAPATRMVSPSAIIDAPAASDVRLGVTYANGSQTGTCIIPSTESVAYGILVDNTTGSAVLKAEDIWKVPITNLTGSGTIGARIKNISTVQSTGAQLAALL